MFALRPHLKRLVWLALLAIGALALLPTVSHALAVAQGSRGGAEICTPQGSRRVLVVEGVGAADAAPAGVPAQAGGHLEHCPWCALAGSALGPPPAAAAVLLLPLAGLQWPAAFLHAPRMPFAWRSAQPRGPPSFS